MLHRVTIKERKNFLKQLRNARVEKDVEQAYRDALQKYYGGNFESPFGCDGYLEPDKENLLAKDETALRILLEAKWQKNFEDGDRFKLIAQAIYYMKKFQQAGDALPNIIVGGDENEIFTIYAPKLYHYLREDYDWNIAPSDAGNNEDLRRALDEDPNIKDVFVFRIEDDFDIAEVFNTIDKLRDLGEMEKLRIDETTLRKAFDRFVRMVFGNDRWIQDAKKIGADQIVSIFIQSILGNDDVYIHPNKPNILVYGQQKIIINGSAYNAFFSRYDRRYSSEEIDKITAVADQLIEEVKRRFHGDFWTPTIWADEAIKMITRDLGEDWRERYIVWDPAAGTKNLTRDYHFGHLFSSTLHQSEIDMSKQYNPEAISFQYDFLNDDIDVNPDSDPRDLKMPRELFEALKSNKPIIFYTNPPYGQASNQNIKNKVDIADTKIGRLMRSMGLGHASSELYTQFIYRVQKIAKSFKKTEIYIFFFTNKGYLTSPAFGKFTDQLLNQFRFNDGFMINAGEFQGTASNWGIIFSNFSLRSENKTIQNEFIFDILKSNEGGIELIKQHKLHKINKKDSIIQLILGNETRRKNRKNIPKINGGFNLPKNCNSTAVVDENCLGLMEYHGFSVQNSDQYVHLNSTSSNDYGHGYFVYPDNFEKICIMFSCRKSILPDASWYNDKDVLRRPSEEFQNSPQWSEFVKDCVVYALFHRSSYMTSLRDFEYNGELYDVKNEWFFMSKNEITKLADKYNLNEISLDARGSEERFVYNYLHTETSRKINLSDEARNLLLAGENLVRACFAKRFITNQDHPEWHLMTWDAGFYQNYKIYTENKKEPDISVAYEKLITAREKLETKIRNQVYKDGILSR